MKKYTFVGVGHVLLITCMSIVLVTLCYMSSSMTVHFVFHFVNPRFIPLAAHRHY